MPEIVDMLRDEFPDREIAVWAAGGIAGGRGVAAALALSAEGTVMGTRVSRVAGGLEKRGSWLTDVLQIVCGFIGVRGA